MELHSGVSEVLGTSQWGERGSYGTSQWGVQGSYGTSQWGERGSYLMVEFVLASIFLQDSSQTMWTSCSWWVVYWRHSEGSRQTGYHFMCLVVWWVVVAVWMMSFHSDCEGQCSLNVSSDGELS